MTGGFLLEHIELDPPGIAVLARKDPDRRRDLLVRGAVQLKLKRGKSA